MMLAIWHVSMRYHDSKYYYAILFKFVKDFVSIFSIKGEDVNSSLATTF